MLKKMTPPVLSGLFAAAVFANVNQPLLVTDFAANNLSDFKEKSFVGNTDYQLVELNGGHVLRATTNANASALYREITIDLATTPYLNWSWRVDTIYSTANQQEKSGDDYPARIYVVVREGLFPWQTKALNYVWSNRDEGKAYWPNPFTADAVMIPVRSGSKGLGQWHSERVNVAEDYYRIFNQRIDQAHGVAIMSDADNTGGSAVAYYGEITFSD